MCEKYWRNCPDCNSTVHMNFKCQCGGNPWNVPPPLPPKVKELRNKIATILRDDIHTSEHGVLIHGAVANLSALVEKEAVGFAEWIIRDHSDEVDGWKNVITNEKLTTAELYQKYIQEKNK